MLNKILKMLEDRGLQQRDLTDALGMSQQLFTDWKAGRSASYKKYLPQIAAFFGVTVDYLLSDAMEEPEKGAPPAQQLSEDEQKLLDTYRSLGEDDRYIALANLIQYARAVSGEKENPIRVPDGDVDGGGVLPPSGGMVGSGVKRS